MPKDEFDPEDPMELFGVGLVTAEDTSEAMAECFVEEFMRLGHNHKQILALFRNPHYLGMNMVLQNKGEPFVKDLIVDVFARWGRRVAWSDQGRAGVPPAPAGEAGGAEQSASDLPALTRPPGRQDAGPALTDPMGGPLPDLTV